MYVCWLAIDIVSVFPYFLVAMAVDHYFPPNLDVTSDTKGPQLTALRLIKLLRMLKLARCFKAATHFSAYLQEAVMGSFELTYGALQVSAHGRRRRASRLRHTIQSCWHTHPPPGQLPTTTRLTRRVPLTGVATLLLPALLHARAGLLLACTCV